MEASVCIAQKGTVEDIAGHRITVRVHRETACGQCNARSMCNLSDIEERIIETSDYSNNFRIGDDVRIAITAGMGNRAVLLGYLLPFVLLVTVLISLNALGFQEWVSGLFSLVMLGAYYFILYLFRNRLKKSFTFTISKIA